MYIYISNKIVNIQIMFECFLHNGDNCRSIYKWKASLVTHFNDIITAEFLLFKTILFILT